MGYYDTDSWILTLERRANPVTFSRVLTVVKVLLPLALFIVFGFGIIVVVLEQTVFWWALTATAGFLGFVLHLRNQGSW